MTNDLVNLTSTLVAAGAALLLLHGLGGTTP